MDTINLLKKFRFPCTDSAPHHTYFPSTNSRICFSVTTCTSSFAAHAFAHSTVFLTALAMFQRSFHTNCVFGEVLINAAPPSQRIFFARFLSTKPPHTAMCPVRLLNRTKICANLSVCFIRDSFPRIMPIVPTTVVYRAAHCIRPVCRAGHHSSATRVHSRDESRAYYLP